MVVAADVPRSGYRQAVKPSRVQWWKCNNGPLVRYARQSARLFPPPPAGSSKGHKVFDSVFVARSPINYATVWDADLASMPLLDRGKLLY